jgi:hypothetical protein
MVLRVDLVLTILTRSLALSNLNIYELIDRNRGSISS